MARVLHLIATTHRRGAETFAVELAAHLRTEGHDVEVLAVTAADAAETLDVAAAGTHRFSLRGFARVLQACKRADVVVSFGSISLLTGAVAAFISKTPFVYRNIGDPSVWGDARFSGVRIGAPLRTAVRIVALYPGAAITLADKYHLDPAWITVIPRGVPAGRFDVPTEEERSAAREQLRLDPDRVWLAYVGALSTEKDPLLAVAALRHLPENIGLVIAGDGPLRAEVQGAAEAFGDRVRRLGVVEDVRSVYAAADLLVLPSHTEGIPGAAIEASMCGRPVVSFDVGGTGSVVLHDQTGLLAPSREPEMYAAAIVDGLERRDELGAAARAHVIEHFSMEGVGGRWNTLISGVTAPRPQEPCPTILQVVASNERRGAEVFAMQLGKVLGPHGFDVTTVAVAGQRTARSVAVRVLGPGRFRPSTLFRLWRAVGSSDIVLVHGGAGLWPSTLAALARRRPLVYRGIGEPSYWGAVRLGKMRIGLPLRRATHVVTLYPAAKEQLVELYGLDPKRVSVIPNGVPPELFPRRDTASRVAIRAEVGVDSETFVVGYLGAMSPEKRPGWAIRAIADLNDAHLIMIGSGPMDGELRRLADAIAPGRVHFLGNVSDPGRFLAAIDALVLPSRTEGMPASIIEAALVGVPVVATDVGGVAGLLDSLGSGVRVPNGDFDQFQSALRSAMESPQLAPERGLAERFSLELIGQRWADALTQLLEERRAATR